MARDWTEEELEIEVVPEISDPVVQRVVDKYTTRHHEGMKTYGMTMAENPAGTREWLEHIQEELMDATLYIERLKDELPESE